MSDSMHDVIRAYILENYLFTDDVAALGFADSLVDRGIVDSTGMLEIILFVEEQFDITVNDEDMTPENFDSVDRIAGYVKRRQQEG